MLAAVSMCIQFRSYLRGAKFTLHTDHKSLVWLHRFKDTEGMMARWLHTLQQFQFSIIHRVGREHGNAEGHSRAQSTPCKQCTRPECPAVDTTVELSDQPFDAESLGDSEDADLVPVQSGEDWVAQLDDDMSKPASQAGELFRITALQLEDATCVTLLEWIRSDAFPLWAEVKSLCPELRFLWHHRNNLSADTNGVIWRKRSSVDQQLQLLIPKAGRQELFLVYGPLLYYYHSPAREIWTLRLKVYTMSFRLIDFGCSILYFMKYLTFPFPLKVIMSGTFICTICSKHCLISFYLTFPFPFLIFIGVSLCML